MRSDAAAQRLRLSVARSRRDELRSRLLGTGSPEGEWPSRGAHLFRRKTALLLDGLAPEPGLFRPAQAAIDATMDSAIAP